MKWLFALSLVATSFACSKDDDDKTTATPVTSPTPTAGTKLTWDADIKTIAVARCGTTACHASGSVNAAYASDEAVFKAGKAGIQDRTASKTLPMPPANASATQKAITADELAKINTFLNQ